MVEEIDDGYWGDRSSTVIDHAGFHLAFNEALAAGDERRNQTQPG